VLKSPILLVWPGRLRKRETGSIESEEDLRWGGSGDIRVRTVISGILRFHLNSLFSLSE